MAKLSSSPAPRDNPQRRPPEDGHPEDEERARAWLEAGGMGTPGGENKVVGKAKALAGLMAMLRKEWAVPDGPQPADKGTCDLPEHAKFREHISRELGHVEMLHERALKAEARAAELEAQLRSDHPQKRALGYDVEMVMHDDGWRSQQELRVTRDGKVILSERDGGEPEDQSFFRDWKWVPVELRAAYLHGVTDGQAAQPVDYPQIEVHVRRCKNCEGVETYQGPPSHCRGGGSHQWSYESAALRTDTGRKSDGS